MKLITIRYRVTDEKYKKAIRMLEEGCTYYAVEKATGLPRLVVEQINILNGDER